MDAKGANKGLVYNKNHLMYELITMTVNSDRLGMAGFSSKKLETYCTRSHYIINTFITRFPLAFIQLSQISLIFFRTLEVLWSELNRDWIVSILLCVNLSKVWKVSDLPFARLIVAILVNFPN
jgi:hypothetical protein